jgi:uncharacterized repeat protein (TIGR04052 family)
MRIHPSFVLPLLITLSSGVVSAISCSSGDTQPPVADAGAGGTAPDAGATPDGDAGGGGSVAFTIKFKATVGAAPFACGTTYTAGQPPTSVRSRDFRFYVQSVHLVDMQDNEVPLVLDDRTPWQTKDVALLDFEDGSADCVEGNPEMNTVITGTAPAGSYKGIVLVNGVPESLNHGDPLKAPAPLQPGAMTWGWLYGFKFLKAELAPTAAPMGDAGAVISLLHLGSTGCDNATDGGMPDFNQPPAVACTLSNRTKVRLSGFDPSKSTIVADLGVLFAGTDLSTDHQCHSDGAACPPLFTAVGVDFVTGNPLPLQTVFHVE